MNYGVLLRFLFIMTEMSNLDIDLRITLKYFCSNKGGSIFANIINPIAIIFKDD